MSTVNHDDIIGYRIKGKDLCHQCAGAMYDQSPELNAQDNFLTADDIEPGESRFCDECEEYIG